MVAFVAPQGELATAPEDHGALIVIRLVQPENEFEDIDAGVPMNRIVERLVQFWKAFAPILVIPLGKDVSARLEQSWKALPKILVIPLGKDVSARVVH